MLQINISTQPIRLDYNVQNAKLNLQSTPAKLQVETMAATLEIHQPRGELTIDSTPSRYSIGLKNNADFARDNAALGRQSAMNAIARIAQEGTQYARIESNSNAFADIAANSCISEAPGLTVAHIEAPNIRYEANPVQFNPTAGKVNFTVQPGKIEGDFQSGKVDIRVTQYPSIQFSTVDVKV
ncbi:MAG TPA: DUF6470 family protein [Desulfosporosinus sp.]|nr:DUF6470 family protein [Desulfosporosinus sp.]